MNKKPEIRSSQWSLVSSLTKHVETTFTWDEKNLAKTESGYEKNAFQKLNGLSRPICGLGVYKLYSQIIF